jgi:hypothetical protein
MFREIFDILGNKKYRYILFVMLCCGVIFACIAGAVGLAVAYLAFG